MRTRRRRRARNRVLAPYERSEADLRLDAVFAGCAALD
jgi:hypothetical protein